MWHRKLRSKTGKHSALDKKSCACITLAWSDLRLDLAVVNYEQAVEPFRQTDRLSDSERSMLMGGACAKAYGWSPKKG